MIVALAATVFLLAFTVSTTWGQSNPIPPSSPMPPRFPWQATDDKIPLHQAPYYSAPDKKSGSDQLPVMQPNFPKRQIPGMLSTTTTGDTSNVPQATPSSAAAPQQATTSSNALAQQVTLAIGILVFFGIALVLEVLVMLRQGVGWGPEATKIVGLTLILASGLTLIVAGYSQDQIAPMVGLLGTVAGYLMGQSARTPLITSGTAVRPSTAAGKGASTP